MMLGDFNGEHMHVHTHTHRMLLPCPYYLHTHTHTQSAALPFPPYTHKKKLMLPSQTSTCGGQSHVLAHCCTLLSLHRPAGLGSKCFSQIPLSIGGLLCCSTGQCAPRAQREARPPRQPHKDEGARRQQAVHTWWKEATTRWTCQMPGLHANSPRVQQVWCVAAWLGSSF